jgi:glycosyltransferase involved in cell wall biosynthesis
MREDYLVPITIVILTYNEELNIVQSLSNVLDWAKDVIVLDSGSTDRTTEIANNLGAKVIFRKFDNFASQRSYAINEFGSMNEWMFFLDADEYLMEDLKLEILGLFYKGIINNYDGYLIKRRFYFMGKWIKYGGYYPTWILRLFKPNIAKCEREINEHIHISGRIGKLACDFVDRNNKSFSDWIIKHNIYSDFEAVQLVNASPIESNFFGSQAERKSWIRINIWNELLPPLVRPFMYFIYRYFFRFGFMDGKAGFIFHFMQGLVFLLMIDIKYLEFKLKKK